MPRYQLRPPRFAQRAIVDTGNGLLLRVDLHLQFDAQKFVFYPKPSVSLNEADVFVVHVMVPSTELASYTINSSCFVYSCPSNDKVRQS
jgi:hypothetical protein